MLDIVELSRLQFALTALYHFLFVPLTLGLSFLLVVMETIYVVTGKQVYKDMTKFWGKLFGINFALGVTTGITMEFQFGTNWSFYSHYVGDIFGAPLAIEALVAFFMESTFVGLFFFGWDRLSKGKHLMTTYLVAIGSNFSALWILVANGWMQNPIGSEFSFESMRMEMANFAEIVLNPVAQSKFLHTLSAGYTCGAIFVLSISSYFILKGRDLGFAKRSFTIASSFGLIAIISTLIMGDESGYEIGLAQPTKLAAMEGEWHTEPAPAAWNLIVVPNEAKQENSFALQIPYAAGIIATRSLDTKIIGLKDIEKTNEQRIRNGVVAYNLLMKLRNGSATDADKAQFSSLEKDLGFGLLLKTRVADINQATDADIKDAARHSYPAVGPTFWSFRIMMLAGGLMLLIFIIAFAQSTRRTIGSKPWLSRAFLWSMPLPWIAIECGWFLAEYGRQPWAVYDLLPVGISNSALSTGDLWFSIGLLCTMYSVFLVAEMYLMFKYARLGPSVLKTGRYHFEQSSKAGA